MFYFHKLVHHCSFRQQPHLAGVCCGRAQQMKVVKAMKLRMGFS